MSAFPLPQFHPQISSSFLEDALPLVSKREPLPQHLFWELAWSMEKQPPYRETFCCESLRLTRGGRWSLSPEPEVLRKQTLQRLAEAAVQVSCGLGRGARSLALSRPDGPGCVGLVIPWLTLQRRGLLDKLILNLFS